MKDEWTQLSLFDAPPLRITNKVRLIELFSGIGAQAKAMERLGADFETWRAYDIDKYAVQAYNAIHGTSFVPTDITKIHADDLGICDRDKFTYLLTYSFPCQDLSLSGFRKGMKRGSGTRSGLLWEVERLLLECGDNLPHILVMENVKQVIGEKNKRDFDEWRESLTRMGYTSQYQILNAKDYGIPQNRQRCFMVSWLGNWTYSFPDPIPLNLMLKDMLEDNVEDKYYLTDEQVSTFEAKNIENEENGKGFRFEPYDPNEDEGCVASTILAKDRAWLVGNYIKCKAPTTRAGRVVGYCDGNRGDVFSVSGSIGALTASMYKTPPLILCEEGDHE